MNTKQSVLLTSALAFASGFLGGLLYASESGRQVRAQVSQRAAGSSRWLEQHLHGLEERLHELEGRLNAVSEGVGARVRQATDRAAEHYVPQAPSEWDMHDADLARSLRRMPRR